MEMESIVSLVSSVGFPIVCCIMMWKYINTTVKELSNTIAENTRVISILIDKIDE